MAAFTGAGRLIPDPPPSGAKRPSKIGWSDPIDTAFRKAMRNRQAIAMMIRVRYGTAYLRRRTNCWKGVCMPLGIRV
jgi:hypothetical protein